MATAKTEDTRALYERLLAVQTEVVAPKKRRNNFANYDYRNAEDILEAVKPLLLKHGLALTISDDIVQFGDRTYVKATCFISLPDREPVVGSVAYAREDFDKKGMDGAQITGAASSYARKYALNGLFLIDDSRDSDDIAASSAPPQQAAPKAPAKAQAKAAPKQQAPQADVKVAPANPNAPTREQWAKLAALGEEMGFGNDRQQMRAIAANLFGKDEYLESMKTMTRAEISTMIDNLEYDLHPPIVEPETGEILPDIDDIPF